jgi:hypothetical protein
VTEVVNAAGSSPARLASAAKLALLRTGSNIGSLNGRNGIQISRAALARSSASNAALVSPSASSVWAIAVSVSPGQRLRHIAQNRHRLRDGEHALLRQPRP